MGVLLLPIILKRHLVQFFHASRRLETFAVETMTTCRPKLGPTSMAELKILSLRLAAALNALRCRLLITSYPRCFIRGELQRIFWIRWRKLTATIGQLRGRNNHDEID